MKITIALFLVALAAGVGEFVPAQDAVKLSPTMYTVLLENEKVRVLEFRCKPGEKEPVHSHPALVAYSLTAAKFKETTPDGKVREGETKPGAAVWSEAVTHAWECLGPGEQRTVITELKGGAKR